MARKTAASKKHFHKIGDACRILDIQPYVLRYWETEFPVLKPDKSRSGQRVYGDDELQIIRRIKELLYEEGYTIAGAKKKLEAELTDDGSLASPPPTPEAAPAAPTVALDSAATEKIEKLHGGLREAIGQSREILRLLDPASS